MSAISYESGRVKVRRDSGYVRLSVVQAADAAAAISLTVDDARELAAVLLFIADAAADRLGERK